MQYETVIDVGIRWTDRVCVAKHKKRKTEKKMAPETAIH